MRKLAVLTMTVAALVIPSAAQAQAQDSVVGSGHVLLTDFVVAIQSGPNGENPTGTLELSGFVSGIAVPTCLRVSGNTAVAAYVFEAGPNIGQAFIAEVQDNGPPMNGLPVDVVTYAGFLDTGPLTACPAPGAGPPAGFSSVGAGPLSSGDVTVTDAPSLPNAQDQCKNGGWRDFGLFKNQGDCISFVATGGKNPPGKAAG
jgi:hypothetical protein